MMMLETLKLIIQSVGVYLMILPFAIAITALLYWVVEIWMDRYLGDSKHAK